MCKLVSVLQVRRQGEADAEHPCPVITAAASPPPQWLPGLDLVRGGMEGTGRGGKAEMQKRACVKRGRKKIPTAPQGDGGFDTTFKLIQTRTRRRGRSTPVTVTLSNTP